VAPNSAKQAFILDTGTNALFTIPLDANAISAVASFSPDNLKAFIAVKIQPGSGVLYVYSNQAALQTIPLSAPADDVAFLPDGAFGFLAEPAGLSYLATCSAPGSTPTNTATAPGAIAIHPLSNLPDSSSLPKSMGFAALAPPNVELVTSSVTGTGCAPSLGVSNVGSGTFNLGQGSFTPLDFLVSSDGQKAFVLIQNQASVVVFDIVTKAVSSIALVGNPTPLAASLSADGLTLYVTGNDNTVHVINTATGADALQLSIPSTTLCSVSTGGTPSCQADLLATRH
jgi:hypothetical protein